MPPKKKVGHPKRHPSGTVKGGFPEKSKYLGGP